MKYKKSILSSLTLSLALGLTGCNSDDSTVAETTEPAPAPAPSCTTKQEAFPISSALEVGPTSDAFYNTVSPFEYADIERTHVHRADFFIDDPDDVTVVSDTFEGFYESAYNIVTRDRDEAFLYGGLPFPYIAKFDVNTGENLWTAEIPQPPNPDAFDWIGLVVTHGNGDVYAVDGGIMVRLDAETGEIKQSKRLPPPEGVNQDDVVYNGFTVAPNGNIIAKSFARPEGCEELGERVLLICVTDETPQPPSLVSVLDPETLDVLSSVLLPESITGRPAMSQFEGQDYVYLSGIEDIYRLVLNGNDIGFDDSWQFTDFLIPGQTNPSTPVVMGDWVVFQTNGTPSEVPMTIHAVAQADSSLSTSRDPFSPHVGISFVGSSLTADPETFRIYSQDAGRGQIGSFELVATQDDIDIVEHWVVDQRTLAHVTLIGPAEERILVATDAPGAVAGLRAGSTDYTEQMVWRQAETGEELARSDILPAMFNGGPVTPGFDATMFYLGLDGMVYELATYDAESVCDD